MASMKEALQKYMQKMGQGHGRVPMEAAMRHGQQGNAMMAEAMGRGPVTDEDYFSQMMGNVEDFGYNAVSQQDPVAQMAISGASPEYIQHLEQTLSPQLRMEINRLPPGHPMRQQIMEGMLFNDGMGVNNQSLRFDMDQGRAQGAVPWHNMPMPRGRGPF